MADEDGEQKVDEEPKPAPRKRGPRKQAPVMSAKLEARGQKIAETIREISGWIRRHAPQEELGFADTIERDATKIGGALASLGNRFKLVGRTMDLLFGEGGPLSILVALSPSIRAGRRSLAERRTVRRAQAKLEAEAEEEWLEQQKRGGGEL